MEIHIRINIKFWNNKSKMIPVLPAIARNIIQGPVTQADNTDIVD